MATNQSPARGSDPSRSDSINERLVAETPPETAVLYTDRSKARGREEAGNWVPK